MNGVVIFEISEIREELPILNRFKVYIHAREYFFLDIKFSLSLIFILPPGNSQKFGKILSSDLKEISTFPCQSISATVETYIFFIFN